jgi:hypothetical protein
MSYALHIGKNLTADGHAYLAGYGDEPSGHWLEIIPRQTHAAGQTIAVGVIPQALMPGVRTTIPQVAVTFRHLRVSYSHYRGVPAPITNGGLNEHGVAVRDVWSPSRPELVAMTPQDQRGPHYSDLAKLVLERATSARHGVDLMGDIIAQHGYSCYGGNSHMIADDKEAWVVIQFSGGLGLWVAERLGADCIRASRPGYIGEIPLEPNDDFRFPDHFVSTAEQLGFWNRSARSFNVNDVYGDGKGRGAGAAWIEDEMQKRCASGITRKDVFWAISNPTLTGDTAGYGQVVPLHGTQDAALSMMWHAPVGAVTAPLLPVFLAQTDVPMEFGAHRYLMSGESARFLDARHAEKDDDTVSHVSQGQETSRSAVQVFKRLMHLAFQGGDEMVAEVSGLCRALEERAAEKLPDIVESARILLGAGQQDLAKALLTEHSTTQLMSGLDLADTLAPALELKLKLSGGLNLGLNPRSPSQLW